MHWGRARVQAVQEGREIEPLARLIPWNELFREILMGVLDSEKWLEYISKQHEDLLLRGDFDAIILDEAFKMPTADCEFSIHLCGARAWERRLDFRGF